MEPFYVKAQESYKHKTKMKGELAFKKGDVIKVCKTNEEDMKYYGVLSSKSSAPNREGWFPYFYVKKMEISAALPPTSAAVASATAATAAAPTASTSSAPSSLSAASSASSASAPITTAASTPPSATTALESPPVLRVQSDRRPTEASVRPGSIPRAEIDKKYVLKSGMLKMKSNKIGKAAWKDKWFVLRPDSLCYYKSAVETKPRGRLELKSVLSEQIEFGQQLYQFSVNTTKKSLVVSAASSEERDEWLAFITYARAGCSGELPTVSKSVKAISSTDTAAAAAAAAAEAARSPTPDRSADSPTNERRGSVESRERTNSTDALHSNGAHNEEEEEDVPKVVVRAVYPYNGRTHNELTFQANDEFFLIEKRSQGWCLGEHKGQRGFFPESFVRIVQTEPTPSSGTNETPAETAATTTTATTNKPDTPPATATATATATAAAPSEEPKPKEEITSPSITRQAAGRTKTSLTIGKYILGEQLGKGAYGSVFKSLDVDSGFMVAVKQVDLKRIKRAELESTMAELELLRKLDHINIVKYVDFIRTPSHINIVLEFIEGGSLAVILKKFGSVPEKLAARYVRQVLEGLDYLHTNGVIHRDIKCGNILITKEGIVKLADFGISTKLGEEGAADVACGSPFWTAPEVIKCEAVTATCDIWSLGCTIIELVQGEPPYFELTAVQALYAMTQNDAPPFPEDISPDLESFLRECFVRDPVQRHTAAELLHHAWVGGPGLEQSSNVLSIRDIESSAPPESRVSDERTTDSREHKEHEHQSESGTGGGAGTGASVEEDDDDDDEEEEEAAELRKWTTQIKELLHWINGAMEKENVAHVLRFRIAIRKCIRDIVRAHGDEQEYKPILKEARAAVRKCEEEFGSHIAMDNDSDDDNHYYEDSDFSDEFDEDSDGGF